MHAGNKPSHYYIPNHALFSKEGDDARGYKGEGWYFWDESEAFVIGPHQTYDGAEEARKNYEP